MRKKNKILNLIVFVLICSFLAADLSQIASAREVNKQVLAITKKDVKNGKVVVKNKKVKSIIIKKNVKKATIKLSNVKLSEEIVFEKGNYTLQSSKSKVTAIQIAEKNTQLKLDKKADLNSKNLVLKVKDATSGNLDFANYQGKLNLELGKKSNLNLKIGTAQKAEVTVKKAELTSELSISGSNSNAKLKKIVLEKPLSVSIDIEAKALQIKEGAKKSDVVINNKIDKIQNTYDAQIKDNTQKDDTKNDNDMKNDNDKKDDTKNPPQDGAGNGGSGGAGAGGSGSSGGGGGSSSDSGGTTNKKVESIALSGASNIHVDDATTEISVNYVPYNAGNKNVEWKIIDGEKNVKILSSNSNKAVIKALNNGSYTVQAALKEDASIKASVSGQVSNQKVSIKGDIGIAGAGEISGLKEGFGYLLESDGEYFATTKDGKAKGPYKTEKEAINRMELLNVTTITNLDNGKSYRIVQFNSDKMLELKLENYMAIKESDISILNWKEITQLQKELDDGIKIKLNNNVEVWKEKQERFNAKTKEIKSKLDNIAMQLKEISRSIENLYKEIRDNLSLDEAKTILNNIDTETSKYPEGFFEGLIQNLDQLLENYRILKQEVKEKEAISKSSLKLDEKGNVYFESAIHIEKMRIVLVKAEGNENKEIKDTEKEFNDNKASMLQEMRKSGVGTYFVAADKGFQYLTKNNDSILSNTQEVKMLTNTLGHLTLTGGNFEKTKDEQDSNKIRMNLEEGTLEWDAVENATSYDVYGEISFGNTDSWGGRYYLNPINGIHQDKSNIENENNFLVLPVENYKTKWDKNLEETRLACGGNLKETKLYLKDILLTDAKYSDDLLDENGKGLPMYIKIWIVPRNIGGLYINDYSNVKNSIDNVVMENFTLKDYLSKFLGIK